MDRPSGKVSVKLFSTEIENSPPVASDQPVSRQMEARMYAHFGWDPYWDNNPKSTDTPDLDNGGSHLRSLNVMRGYHIRATDGLIGQAADFLLNDDDWSIRYIVVDTGNWWPGQKVLISPHSVNSIAWTEREIRVSVNQDKVKSAPHYSPDMTIDGKYEEEFLTYYGIRWLER